MEEFPPIDEARAVSLIQQASREYEVSVEVAGGVCATFTVLAINAEHARTLGSRMVTLNAKRAYKPTAENN